MVLTPAQRQALNRVPAKKQAKAKAFFNNQNRSRNGPARGRGNGRGRGRGRQNFNTSFARTTPNAAPAAEGYVTKLRQAQGNTVSTTAYIPIEIGTETKFTSHVVDIRPSSFPWINNFDLMYCRYKIVNFSYKYVSQSPSNIGGSVWFAFQADTSTLIPASLGEAQQFLDFNMHNVWHSPRGWTKLPNHLSDRWFASVTNTEGEVPNPGDRAFLNHTPARLLYGTTAVDAPNSTPGFIECNITVVFRDRYTVELTGQPVIEIKKRPPIGETVVRGLVKTVDGDPNDKNEFPLPLPPFTKQPFLNKGKNREDDESSSVSQFEELLDEKDQEIEKLKAQLAALQV